MISGFLWVPAGVAIVVAVQHIGIACGQAIWQVTITLTSFFWGFVVLHDEAVYNWEGTALALSSVILGVLGMTASFNMPGYACDGELEEEPNWEAVLMPAER